MVSGLFSGTLCVMTEAGETVGSRDIEPCLSNELLTRRELHVTNRIPLEAKGKDVHLWTIELARYDYGIATLVLPAPFIIPWL